MEGVEEFGVGGRRSGGGYGGQEAAGSSQLRVGESGGGVGGPMEGVGESGVGRNSGEGQEVAALRQREPWLHEDFRCPRERRGKDLLGPHGPWCFPALVGDEGTASVIGEVESRRWSTSRLEEEPRPGRGSR